MINYETPPMLNIDNQNAIKLIGNPEFHERSKHIETRYHFATAGRRKEDRLPVHPNRGPGCGYIYKGPAIQEARNDEEDAGDPDVRR